MRLFHLLRLRVLPVAIFAVLALIGVHEAAARPAAADDFTQFGFPQVSASVLFTPGQATTLTAGTQQVVLPADFISKSVKFELLTGDPNFFTPLLESDDRSRPILAAFAFRVTDMATGQQIESFDKDVQWSVTDPRVADGTDVYDTSADNPPKITENPTPGTVSGTTFTHSFDGADEGWLALGPRAAVGMPNTGAPAGSTALAALAALAGLLCALVGLAVRQRGWRA
jgi:hypothetical protein